jgi:PAS domain S-box-containing protein
MADRLFQGVFVSDLMGFTIFDASTGETLAVNDRFLAMTGHSRADFDEGRWDWREFTPAEYLPLDETAIRSVVETGRWTAYEKEYRRRDGSRFQVRLSSAPIPGEPGRVVVGIEDITVERAATEALAESVAQARRQADELKAIFDAAPTGLCVLDRDLRYVRINNLLAEVNGLPASEHVGRTVAEIVPDLTDQALATLHRVLSGEEVWGVEFAGTTQARPGVVRTWRENWLPLRNAAGEIVGVTVSAEEITDELAAERALKESNARVREQQRLIEAEAARREADALYRAYFENTPEALFIISVSPEGDYRVEETNRAHQIGVGLKLQDIQGRRMQDILPEPALSRVLETYDIVVRTGQPYQYREVFELHDERAHWDTTLVPMHDATGRVIRLIGSSRNVTPQVAAEEALRQSQKMEAMGQLTGGVAHDFNNLLTPIIGALDLLQRNGLGGAREQRLIDGALQSAERARTLVQRLLSFARRQPLQPTAVDIGALVEGMRGLLGTTLGPQIRLDVSLAEDLPPARADANQIEMALLNLVVNARDAMPDGGTLRVEVDSNRLTSDHLSGLAEGDYVCLTVSDTGHGMDEATLARAVEPFFSTKGVGRGTGLGLSMVHGLAQQLGGALDLKSRPGVGTRIRLCLPVCQEAFLASGPQEEASLGQRLSGRVLLVDDEALVRAATADMLVDLGYEVSEVENAAAALERLEANPDFDLVITDHMMPGQSGADLARTVKARRPSLSVLIVSGYADVEGIAPDLPRLVKPFNRRELTEALRRLTESGRGPLNTASH